MRQKSFNFCEILLKLWTFSTAVSFLSTYLIRLRAENDASSSNLTIPLHIKEGAVTFGKTEKVQKSIKKDHIYRKKCK